LLILCLPATKFEAYGFALRLHVAKFEGMGIYQKNGIFNPLKFENPWQHRSFFLYTPIDHSIFKNAYCLWGVLMKKFVCAHRKS